MLHDNKCCRIYTLSNFIENGDTKQEKIDRFIVIHYYILASVDDQRIIDSAKFIKFKDLILESYHILDTQEEIDMSKYREWQFLSSQYLNTKGIQTITNLVYDALYCQKPGYFELDRSKHYDDVDMIDLKFISSIVIILSFMNIYLSVAASGIIILKIILLVIDSISLLYILSYAMVKTEWIYNFEEIYSKQVFDNLWNSQSAQRNINAIYHHRKERKGIYRILIKYEMIDDIINLILDYTMPKNIDVDKVTLEPNHYDYKGLGYRNILCGKGPTLMIDGLILGLVMGIEYGMFVAAITILVVFAIHGVLNEQFGWLQSAFFIACRSCPEFGILCLILFVSFLAMVTTNGGEINGVVADKHEFNGLGIISQRNINVFALINENDVDCVMCRNTFSDFACIAFGNQELCWDCNQCPVCKYYASDHDLIEL